MRIAAGRGASAIAGFFKSYVEQEMADPDAQAWQDYVADVRSLERQRERAIVDREDASRALDLTRRRLGI